jgi:VIT1/CCC1 family predicted Fe2+/Mn2+ transporter
MSEVAIQLDARAEEGILDPINRFTEILFGLIMVLTFTCSLSAAEAGRGDVREMLYAALGCNIAWGIIDAFFYLMSAAAQRGRERVLVNRLKETSNERAARRLFQSVIPESIIGSLSSSSVAEIRDHLLRPAATRSPLLTFADVRAGVRIFVLVFLTTFPVAVPFMLMHDAGRAVRLSNLVALTLLFSIGYSLGHYAGRRAFVWGLSMTMIGAALVSITIALGG